MNRFKTQSAFCVQFQNEEQERLFNEETLSIREPYDVASEFETLLNTNSSEQQIQDFFEENPRYLPQAGFYHNGLRSSVVVSKLPLQNDFVTDFAYMSENSQEILVVCIELEKPDKKIFRRDGNFTSEFHQAKQQVVDWNYWAQTNRSEALKYFGKLAMAINPKWLDVSLQSILVYGRRSEISNRKRQERWSAEAALLPRSIQIMTYDRLLDSMKSSFYRLPDNHKIIVCSYRDRALQAKYVRA
jgi:hypothetical protein